MCTTLKLENNYAAEDCSAACKQCSRCFCSLTFLSWFLMLVIDYSFMSWRPAAGTARRLERPARALCGTLPARAPKRSFTAMSGRRTRRSVGRSLLISHTSFVRGLPLIPPCRLLTSPHRRSALQPYIIQPLNFREPYVCVCVRMCALF